MQAAAALVAKQFVEVLMAPSFTAEALAIFAAKANARLLQIDLPAGGNTPWLQGRNRATASASAPASSCRPPTT